jgi:hypothetical protein
MQLGMMLIRSHPRQIRVSNRTPVKVIEMLVKRHVLTQGNHR